MLLLHWRTNRQPQRKPRALTWLTLYIDGAMQLHHGPMHHSQPQAGSALSCPRGVEGLQQVLHRHRIDTPALVRHHKTQPLAR